MFFRPDYRSLHLPRLGSKLKSIIKQVQRVRYWTNSGRIFVKLVPINSINDVYLPFILFYQSKYIQKKSIQLSDFGLMILWKNG